MCIRIPLLAPTIKIQISTFRTARQTSRSRVTCCSQHCVVSPVEAFDMRNTSSNLCPGKAEIINTLLLQITCNK